MINIQHLQKKRRVTDATFQIETGKIIGIIGENGSGKTTILEMIAGVLRSDKGEINLPADRSEILSFSSDQDYFYDYFTVTQLVDFYQSQFADFHREKAEELIDFFSIPRQEKMAYLSKGQTARVKLAVTLARNCPLFMLDEPLAGLDPMVKEKIVQGLIRFIDLEKQSLLITTHELLEVEAILDEVVVMKQGKVIAQQAVENIREETSVQEWLKQMYA
ncbi:MULTISPECIES: ATP-binding cassette domain-containing protein [Gracilibacillus]|uniref:ATP-binding cassette domain-containing protein n=1 Tax=Gracilibacillus TaxID=74385 RepID=UPI000824FB78|nr:MULTISPECIES: ABC transporter ATP-binding protein [Gracilibacillus]